MEEKNQRSELEQLNWRIPKDLKRKLKAISAQENISMADLIFNAVSTAYDKPGGWLTIHQKLDKILQKQSN